MLRKKLTKGTARATVYTPSDYPRRQYPKLNEDKYVKLLMDRLQELKQKTHPEGGSKSAKNKDLAAFEALQLAGVLVQCVAGWAVDHEAGLALEGLEFVPSVPPEMQNRPEYLAAG